jgi:voltage-gated potassium channel
MSRELVVANLFLAVVLIAGTIGYTLIEGWSWMDSLYMTFITLTTIGFREVHSLSSAGRFFTIVIGLTGIGSVAFIATRTAQVLLNTQAFRIKRMMKSIDATSDHYILAGFGRIGQRIARDLKRNEVPFVIIEMDESKEADLERLTYNYLIGDAETEEVLEAAGIERARGLILTLPEDRANVFATLVAREMNPDLFIMVRTDTNANRRKLIRSGADKVVAPYEIGADRMAQVLLRPSVERFMERVMQSDALAYSMDEVLVEAGSELAGKTLQQANFRQRFDAIVVAVMDGQTKGMTFNPGPAASISDGDTLIVMGSTEMISRLRTEGCSSKTVS